LSADLLNAVVDAAGTGRFLPYDKDRRWSSRKDEQVIVEEIIHRPALTVIPTLPAGGQRVLKIHYYGDSPPDPDQAARWSQATAIGDGTWTRASGSSGASTPLLAPEPE
jgi:hypothetical protein